METGKRRWRPAWKGAIEYAIINKARRNAWRLPTDYGMDDLIQDGYLCYARCRRKYTAVEDPRHFMRLVLTTFHRHITDLANERTARNECNPSQMSVGDAPASIETAAEGAEWTSVGRDDRAAAAELRFLLADAPPDLRRFIKRMVEFWGEGEPRPAYAKYKGRREPMAEYFCHLAGVPMDRSIIERLKAWAGGEIFLAEPTK